MGGVPGFSGDSLLLEWSTPGDFFLFPEPTLGEGCRPFGGGSIGRVYSSGVNISLCTLRGKSES